MKRFLCFQMSIDCSRRPPTHHGKGAAIRYDLKHGLRRGGGRLWGRREAEQVELLHAGLGGWTRFGLLRPARLDDRVQGAEHWYARTRRRWRRNRWNGDLSWGDTLGHIGRSE